MTATPYHRWQVLADHHDWQTPRRVSRHATEGQARAEARRLNAADPRGPLHFVERWETSNVMDVERSRTR